MAKIIIAEDELTSRRILVKGVESLGHVAIQCSDGNLAYHMLQDNPDVALLITDVVMPNMDGRALLELVRKNTSFKDLPVLVVSGKVGPKAIEELLKLGATAFQGKPINLNTLTEFVTGQLEES